MPTFDESNATSVPGGFTVRFGESATNDATGLLLPMRVLGGAAEETIFKGGRALPRREGFSLWERDGVLVGISDEPAGTDLVSQARDTYRRLLTLTEGRRLARVWNYVPGINEPDVNGLENYRAFCCGRSLAFEERLGGGYAQHLPAASAVGGVDGRLTVIFAATLTVPVHAENAEQTPAYEYPSEHGPRAPSFARATRVTETGSGYVFISGTAAIKGHATMAPGDLRGQIDCTLDNLRIISRACDLGERLGEGGAWRRHFKVYLRHAGDYAVASKALDGRLFTEADQVTWLRSDICRAALLIEIEATLVASA